MVQNHLRTTSPHLVTEANPEGSVRDASSGDEGADDSGSKGWSGDEPAEEEAALTAESRKSDRKNLPSWASVSI
ncbi:hypothetical protein PI124_g17100 [Phytophthora idaei]|nr:hypothetical protein PI125_g17631 [Phytophthora idaei]KAG3129637.1 hypothetical protein PI126_g20872 [Phytophthora idaei]KAG3237926.1 hypothetical protein PI124_g17100 [Phytophthora idaei]